MVCFFEFLIIVFQNPEKIYFDNNLNLKYMCLENHLNKNLIVKNILSRHFSLLLESCSCVMEGLYMPLYNRFKGLKQWIPL